MLLLNKAWMDHLEHQATSGGSGIGPLTGEDKHLIWLQAWTAVHAGTACWLHRWDAVTWGNGPDELDRVDNTGRPDYGGDDRFKDGVLQGHMIKRPRDPAAVAREQTRKR